MRIRVIQDGQQTEAELADGVVSIGGAATDGVVLVGLAPAVAQLTIKGGTASFQSRETLAINGVLFPAGVDRLLLPEERVELATGIELVLLEEKNREEARQQGTAFVLKQLLVETQEPEDTRAACLLCLTGLDTGRRFPLAFQDGYIGRGERVEIRIRDRSVSRQHARLFRDGDRYRVEDAASGNGTYLNGKAVSGSEPLAPGDVLELGHSILRFEGPRAEVATPESIATPALEEPAPTVDSLVEPEAAPCSEKSPRRKRMEWLLITFGAALALAGGMVCVSSAP